MRGCWEVRVVGRGPIRKPYGMMERMVALILGVLRSWGLLRGEGADQIQVTNAQSC